MWLKIRLAPMCPWFGMVSLAFVGPPTIKVQLAPYNRVRLMKIPFLQVLPHPMILAASCMAACQRMALHPQDMTGRQTVIKSSLVFWLVLALTAALRGFASCTSNKLACCLQTLPVLDGLHDGVILSLRSLCWQGS